MQKIAFRGREFQCEEKETVLDVLVRNDIPIPHSCRSGVCHSCLVKAVKGRPSIASQAGLKETLAHQKYFLACQCIPENFIEVAIADESVNHFVDATVISKKKLSEAITRVRIKTDEVIDYKAGQFLNIKGIKEQIRSYSIASIPSDDFIEFHIQRMQEGVVSTWLSDQIEVGEHLKVSEPVGECFYLGDNKDQSLLLIGTGSGLAPLYGIVSDALQQGHSGEIYLYHGGRTLETIYYRDKLQALAQQHPNFTYTACISDGSIIENTKPGRASQIALTEHPALKNWKVFVCGNPSMVNDTKKAAFLAGASLKDIFSDAFVPAS
ncbi:MAG: 2Fe-2S iron-sulfur cluster-binding protein [Gammaproteobacteria bacterium]|nr:2Fe-2S iron-sulfur cluster-binding protein [Gammaproteobacteria bacterium]MDH5728989.1 2Fe-2S iron-sulfur cluster-binding protein [Gammaproteobacteria bacterium]